MVYSLGGLANDGIVTKCLEGDPGTLALRPFLCSRAVADQTRVAAATAAHPKHLLLECTY